MVFVSASVAESERGLMMSKLNGEREKTTGAKGILSIGVCKIQTRHIGQSTENSLSETCCVSPGGVHNTRQIVVLEQLETYFECR